MPQERRLHARVHFDTPARLAWASRELAVRVLDLSLRGALLQIPHTADVCAGLKCELTIPLINGESIAMSVQVARLHGACVGLHCIAMDIDSMTHLRRLVELQLGDAVLLERELAQLGVWC